MEHVKRQIQQGAGNAYYAGMQWRGITLGHADAAALNQFDIDISKAQAPEARTWLLQNKAEFIALFRRYLLSIFFFCFLLCVCSFFF